MKKLIIAAAIVCAAAMSQAAAITWGATDNTIFNGNNTDIVGDMLPVYVIMSTYSQADLVAAYAANKGDIAATISAAGGAVVANDGYTFYGMAIADNPFEGSAGNAYMAIFDAGKMFVSIDAAIEIDPLDPSVGTLNFSDVSASMNAVTPATSFAGAGWYNAVPEPTSGLLLLIGVAGLALRRRRA